MAFSSAAIIGIILVFALFVPRKGWMLGECGMSYGPLYGHRINVKLDEITVDTYLPYPGGEFAISNTPVGNNGRDTIPPLLLKLDRHRNVLWAISLDSEDDIISLYSIGASRLEIDENRISIWFFNESYMEPGRIFLTDNFDFDYMCLSPM